MALKSEQRYRFETGVYRPPSEGGSSSLLVRFTRNCPWNHCTFCGMYKIEKFQVRSVDEIKQDIDAVAALCSDLARVSMASGHGANLTRGAAVELIRQNPELEYHQGFAMVYEWLLSGGKTAFLQDANSIIMKTDRLVETLKYLRDNNISTKCFDSGLAVSNFRDQSTRTRFSFASAANLLLRSKAFCKRTNRLFNSSTMGLISIGML